MTTVDKNTTGKVSVTANFIFEKYRNPNNNWCVCIYRDRETDKEFTATGISIPTQKNMPYVLTGQWGINKTDNRKQLIVEYYETAVPAQKEEVISYLNSLKCGIGKTKAEAIYKTFGKDTYDIIIDNPSKLMVVPGITDNTVSRLIESISQAHSARDLIDLFRKCGVHVSGETIHKIIELHPDHTAEWLKENPYRIIGIDGFSFDKAEAIAESLAFRYDAPERMEAGIVKVLDAAATGGNVCYPCDKLIHDMKSLLKCSETVCQDAVRNAFEQKKIRSANHFIFTPDRYECEKSICDNIVRLILSNSAPIENIDRLIEEYEGIYFTLAENQKEAVRSVFRHPVSIITGGPGTGKTTITKAILYINDAIYGESAAPVLLAPTGKAARRMSETTSYPALTIHSAVGWRGDDSRIDPNVRIEGNLIIVDESSMMDQNIANILFSKIPAGARLVLIGDVDQLPSVGCGNVLSDMIASREIPTTRLDIIFRQSEDNPIIYNAYKINKGRKDLIYGNSFLLYRTKDERDLFESVCSFYLRCARKYGLDSVILLNPQRNNTPLSVDRFNQEIQRRINPPDPAAAHFEIRIGNTVFRRGDRVMEHKNCEFARNGDIGYIREIVHKDDPDNPKGKLFFASIEFAGGKEGVTVEYNTDDLRHVSLAYCTTVHKAQGSEYDTVLMVVSKAHPSMLKRNLLYTGVTRAKKHLVMFGEDDAVNIAINSSDISERYTMLKARLRTSLHNI